MNKLCRHAIGAVVALVATIPIAPGASANTCSLGPDFDLSPACAAASKVVCKVVAGGSPCLD